MRKSFTMLAFAFVAFAGIANTGCVNRPIAAQGVYKGDVILYTAERRTAEAFKALDTYVKWEYDNRALLAQFPEVRVSADYVRANTPKWLQTAYTTRDAYALTRSEADRSNLVSALTVLETALNEAAKYIAAHQQAKLKPQ